MKLEQIQWQGKEEQPTGLGRLRRAQLILLFGSPSALKEHSPFQVLKQAYPEAHILGCSTAGEIVNTSVLDDSMVATVIQFEHTTLHGLRLKRTDGDGDFEAGEKLASHLDKENLVHVFVLSHGLDINGSMLVAGLTKHLPPHVTITGGLAGDGTRFQETLVLWEGALETKSITVLGFYSERLRVGCGSLGGWDTFGHYRSISHSEGNILYELDGKPALPLYKAYLGEEAKGLPATGLLFPLSLLTPESPDPVVRTILSVNEDDQSITFAGDMPQGSYARFMRANFDKLVNGAAGAAEKSNEALGTRADLAILISCVGRKLVLQQRTDEEVKSVRKVLGEQATLAGFYSYGEISPFTPGATCKLHNQTMTITVFSEQ